MTEVVQDATQRFRTKYQLGKELAWYLKTKSQQ
jgi:hypothetical protein